MTPVRTRIAPSPTGAPHVGTAYVALFNYCFAKKHKGTFVLRIEDTDQARSTVESEQEVIKALQWLGLNWDEGPDVQGGYGPYRQSERLEIYQEHIQTLIESRHAFHCFCSEDRLNALRIRQKEQGCNTGYDGHCLTLTREEVEEKKQSREPFVIRLSIPKEGACNFDDLIRGEISIPWSQVDMQILVKQDGFPTYHFANVVDDHTMKITHVIRGEEWINSVPKHIRLYEAFGWEKPVFCHLPLLRNLDKSKLSKRKNPTSINYFHRLGILPSALVNFLALSGWSMPDQTEIFSIEDMVECFDLKRVSTSAPIFDLDKLTWMNGEYLRALPLKEFRETVFDWYSDTVNVDLLLQLLQKRANTLGDIVGLSDYLLGKRIALELDDFSFAKLDSFEVKTILQCTYWLVESISTWERDFLFEEIKKLATCLDVKLKWMLEPIYVAISGRVVALPIFDTLILLGKDLSKERLADAIRTVSVSKSDKKKIKATYSEFLSQELK